VEGGSRGNHNWRKQSNRKLDERQVNKLIEMIAEAKDKKIFIDGMDRSGTVGRAFAPKLMHLGFNGYFIGETITPAAGHEDLVVAISGAGETRMMVT
jgi:6-phospho-3-hexuloisomerase